MNLLPKSKEEFSQKEYWDQFFQKRGKKAFEWYGEYPELCGHLHKYIKPKDEILVVGCGNSKLSFDLYDVGCQQITNIDISKVVIKQMTKLNEDRSIMKFLHMDVTEMTFEDQSFSVVLDKGTLDALMPNTSEETMNIVNKMFDNIYRILRIGGRYICISLLQEHILNYLLSRFDENEWMIRIIRNFESEKNTIDSGETGLPVFLIVCTKMKKIPFRILEICLLGDQIQRVESKDEILESVKSIQQTSIVCSGLCNSNISDMDEVSLDLCTFGVDEPRYTVYVLDQIHLKGNGKYAAFIVPQGRESDWLFSTKEGRKELLKNVLHDRLAVVTLHRGHTYGNLEAIKNELSESIKRVAPLGCTEQIPFLSLGSDVGKRIIRYEGTSTFSGSYIVEDIENENGDAFRRLIFLDNQFIIQSEAKLKKIKSKQGAHKMVADNTYLASQHHIYMIIGIQASMKEKSCSSLIVGLGGGGLCLFLQQCFPKMHVTAVEIDSAMLDVATTWFGLQQNNKLKVEINDGLVYLSDAIEKGICFDTVLFDVNSKDKNIGMSCPPQEFIDIKVLNNVKKCLNDKGVFILNLVCRDESLRTNVLKSLKEVFTTILSYKMEQDLNEVIYCSLDTTLKTRIRNASITVNDLTRQKKFSKDDLIDVNLLFENLNIL